MTEIPVARPAATVILVRDRDGIEVMMVERNSQAYFASALVFPGGIVDPEDYLDHWAPLTKGGETLSAEARALRIAAYRELQEETGVLLFDPAPTPHVVSGFGPYVDALVQRSGQIDLDAMHHFGHWITPATSPKRYDTHFFLCGVETDDIAISDGQETVSVDWLKPQRAIELAAAGERKLLFPTMTNLQLLARSATVAEAIAASKTRTMATVTPQIVRGDDGKVFLTIPDTAGYGPVERFAAG